MALSYPEPLFMFSAQLEMTLDDIKWAIVNSRKLKVKQEVRQSVCFACSLGLSRVGASLLPLYPARTDCESTWMVWTSTTVFES